MNHYEAVFILTPVLSDSQVEEAVKKFHDLLKQDGAKILHKEDWGLKKLAYPIQNKQNGFYHLVEFESDNQEIVGNFELALKRDERIIRYLTLKMDKHAVAWAEERRSRIKANSNSKK